jgi:phage-related tail protein
MEKLAVQRDKVAAKLANSRQFAQNLAKSLTDFAGLANLGGAQTPMGIKINLEGKLTKLRAFATALKALAKRGLSRSLFQQIAEAGPDAGLELAQNFLAMDPAMFKQTNAIQGQINKIAGQIGSSSAQTVFGTAALEKLEASIQKAMDKAADKFAAKIASALSKHSKRASGGVSGGMTWVGEQGPELLNLPYGSSVYSAGDSRRMASNTQGVSKIQLEWVGGNSGDEFLTWLKRNIRAVAGSGPNSVQVALS